MAVCVRKGCGNDIKEVVRALVEFRGWEFIEFFREGATPYVKFKCGDDHITTLTYERLKLGACCKVCGDARGPLKRAKSLAETNPELAEQFHESNEMTLADLTKNSKIIVTWICVEHVPPFLWDMPPGDRFNFQGECRGCPKCNGTNFLQTSGGHDYFVKLVSEKYRNKYSYPEKYVNNLTPITVICPLHNKFKVKPVDHKRGAECPTCTAEDNDSKGIRELKYICTELLGMEFVSNEPMPGLVYQKALLLDMIFRSIRLIYEYDGE